MAGPRSKRKRAEISTSTDPSSSTTTTAPAASRSRRGRDAAASTGAEPTTKEQKNETITATKSKSTQDNDNTAMDTTMITEESGVLKTKAVTAASAEGNDHAEETNNKKPPPKTSLVDHNKKRDDKEKRTEKSTTVTATSREIQPLAKDEAAPPPAVGKGRRASTKRGSTKQQASSATTLSSTTSSTSTTIANPASASSRETKIRNLLEHRKLLLERVRQGRTAAQQRLEIVTSQLSVSKLQETTEQQVAAFREMGRVATSLARKQARSDSEVNMGGGAGGGAAIEKRTLVSLRRGSSVGKRMNAALSSLAPHTSTAATASAAAAAAAAATTTTVPNTASLPDAKKASHQSARLLPKTTTSVPPVKRAASAPTISTAASKMAAAAAAAAVASQGVVPTSKAAAAASSARVATTAAASAGRLTTKKDSIVLNRAIATKSLKQQSISVAPTLIRGVPIAQSSVSSLSARGGRPAGSSAAAGGGGVMMPPNNRMMPPPKPLVICPEAVALRERKKAIEGQLTALFKSRQRRRMELERSGSSNNKSSSPSRDAILSITPVASKPNTATEISPKVLEAALRGPGQAKALPRRRKTHWDTLLAEMRWMATDFIEERKWKMCTSKMIAESVRLHECNATSTCPSARGSEMDESVALKGVEKDESDDCVMEDVTSDSGDKNEITEARMFVEPSAEDLTKARSVGKIVASMILELSTAIEGAGVASGAADEFSKALHRHQLARKRLEGDDGSSYSSRTIDIEDEKTSKDVDSEPNQLDVSQTAVTSDSLESESYLMSRDGSEKDKIFQCISDYVDGVLLKVKDPSSKYKGAAKLPGLLAVASTGQAKMLDRIDDIWSRVETGAILGGSLASGKTILTCSLLWKNRSGGPQLVVCSPSSMIRWMHELDRFKGLRRRPFAANAGISSPAPVSGCYTKYEASDIVVCDFTALTGLSKETLAGFHSIVVDTRFPRAFFGSRQPVYGEYEAVMAQSIVDSELPTELTSSSWWSKLANVTADTRPNRLLIDTSSPNDTRQFLVGLPDRQLLEVLGLRLAFLFGATQFLDLGHSLEKCLLTWARRRIKSTEETGTKFQRVKGLLLNLADSLYCEIEGGMRLEELSLPGANSLSWDVRACEMPEPQRSAYDKACRESRASLSATLTPLRAMSESQNDPFAAVADVLLHFRRVSIHSNCKAVLSEALFGKAEKSPLLCFHNKLGGGPAQPDADLAIRILEGSGKMRELLSILVHECDVQISNFDVLSQFIRKDSWKSSLKGRHKKNIDQTRRVAVLASLPEAQVLASLLLSSVGVDHEVLFRPEWPDTGIGAMDVLPMAWVNCQLILSRFNNETTGFAGHELRSERLVIGSLETVAGDHLGLGVELADIVLCLDEDWSGRSELQMMSLALRCLSRREFSKDDACRFIKFAAANSCEQNFISGGDANEKGPREAHNMKQKSGSWPWPLDLNGSFSVPDDLISDDTDIRECWAAKQPASGMFAFPACNILAMRNKRLSDVLSSAEPLPPLLFSHSEMLFLPRCDEEDADFEVEMKLVASLARHEIGALYKLILRVDHKHDTVVWALNAVSPPHPFDFPGNLIGRRDMAVLPSRLFLQRLFQDAAHWRQGVDGTIAVLPTDLLIPGATPFTDDAPDEVLQLASDGLTVKPSEFAENLLFYGVDDDLHDFDSGRRVNAYSSVFSQLKCAPVAQDGSSGSEPLVYFPPLFPRLQECSELARLSVDSLRSHLPVDSESRKRRIDGSVLPSAKRLLLESGGSDGSNRRVVSAENHLQPLQERQTFEPRLITEDEASHGDAASVLFDLNDDYGLAGIGAVPLPRDSALTSGRSSVEVGHNSRSSDEAGEWLSSGRFPTDAEEVQVAGLHHSSNMDLDSMILFVSQKRPRGFDGFHGQSPHSLLAQGIQAGISHWPGGVPGVLPGSFNDLSTDVNGGGRKPKKKITNQKEPSSGLSAFSRLPITEQRALAQLPPGMQIAKAKEMNRNRQSMLLRHAGLGSTLFEAPLFRAASLRVRMNVAGRIERHGWTSGTAFEVGPGLPLLVSKQPAAFPAYRGLLQDDPNLWTCLVKRLKTKDSATGDEAIEFSAAQQLAFRRSLVSPCRVDFGIFQAGFLSSPSGMTAVPPIRARMGISLPMGVKIQAQKELAQIHSSSEDDTILQRSVERFGMNWVLAARVAGGFQDIVNLSQNDRLASHSPRAPRGCRERWQILIRAKASPGSEVTPADSIQLVTPADSIQLDDPMEIDHVSKSSDSGQRLSFGDARGMTSFIGHGNRNIEFLVPTSEDEDNAETAKVPADVSKESSLSSKPSAPPAESGDVPSCLTEKPRRTFVAIRSAAKKKQVVPLTIPGMVSGSPPTVVPSHPSHLQSVQSAVAASWTVGRTEMWPLQLLDAADRQRASSGSGSANAAISSRPQSSSIRSSSSKSPPISSSSRIPPSANASATSSQKVSGQRPASGTFPSSQSNNAPPRATAQSSRTPSSSIPPFRPAVKDPPVAPSPSQPTTTNTVDPSSRS